MNIFPSRRCCMPLFLLASLLAPANAGYGDTDSQGHPSWDERDVHIWTNAARVQPDAFEDDYNAGGCSYDDFANDENQPVPPLYYDPDLNRAARYHSTNMSSYDCFQHETCDPDYAGEDFASRLARFYTDSSMIGENIAMGYPDPRTVVLQGWMCSTEGHRANIMGAVANYNELGTGVYELYYTQDFAQGTLNTDSPVAMANHEPVRPTDTVTILADWYDADPPDRFQVVLDGVPTDLELTYGSEIQGIYTAELPVPDATADCHQWYVRWTTSTGEQGAFPEEGSLLFGDDCTYYYWWMEGHLTPRGEETGDQQITLLGCSTSGDPPAAPLALMLAALPLVSVRRRR